jgi:hypothetical protein
VGLPPEIRDELDNLRRYYYFQEPTGYLARQQARRLKFPRAFRYPGAPPMRSMGMGVV